MASADRKSVVNIAWAFLSFFATKLLNLAAIVILARLLSPTEMGLMAFCMVVMAYFEIVSRFGLGAALISADRDPEREDQTAHAVFFLATAFSTVMAGALFGFGPLIARWFDQPQLAPMLQVLSIAMIIEGGATVNNALLQKRLRFKRKIVPDTARGLAKGTASITLAFAGFGVWSMVWGYLAGATVFAVALHVVEPWRPRQRPRLAEMRPLLGFGLRLLGGESVNMLNRTLSPLMIAQVLGAAALGIYNLAYRIPELVIKSFTIVAGTVAHPVMAEMQDDAESLRRYFYGCLTYFTVLTFSGGAAIAVLTPPLVHVLYTPTWYGMIVPMQLLGIAFALGTLNMLPGVIYKAIRRPEYLLRVALISLPLSVTTLVLAVPHGLVAVATAEVALAVVLFTPNFYFLSRAVGIRLDAVLHALVPGLACAAATALGGQLAQYPVDAPLAKLVLGGLGAGAAFFATLASTRPELTAQIWAALRRKRRPA